MSLANTARRVRELAELFGARAEMTKNNHYAVYLPNGAIVHTSGTPGDWRADRNLVGQLRRAARAK